MRTRRLAAIVVGSAAVLMLAPTAAHAGPCERTIHATIEGVGHVCLGPAL